MKDMPGVDRLPLMAEALMKVLPRRSDRGRDGMWKAAGRDQVPQKVSSTRSCSRGGSA